MRWAFRAYVAIITAVVFLPIREIRDHILWPYEAQFFVMSDAPIRDLRVSYEGRMVEMRPRWRSGQPPLYAAFIAMKPRTIAPLLEVSWDGPGGKRSLSRVMSQFDSSPDCLYVLTLNADGEPVGPARPDAFSPFWWTCHFR